MSDLWQEYENALATMDWYYMYSDDHRVYQSGRARMDKINEMRIKADCLDCERATKLWNYYTRN